MVRFLIERGADVKIRTTGNNYSVLEDAARYANAEIVQLLIEHGAEVNNADTMGMTPLLYAAMCDNAEAARMLIENGADMEASERYKGFTPLLYACHLLKTKIVTLLVEKGADVNAKDKKGKTPLANACKKGGLEIVKYLVEHGASLQVGKKSMVDVVRDKSIKQYLAELP